MFNIFTGAIDFVSKFWNLLPQPISALFTAFISTFVVVHSFQLIWRLH